MLQTQVPNSSWPAFPLDVHKHIQLNISKRSFCSLSHTGHWSEKTHPVTEEPGNALAPLFPPKLIHPNFVNSTFRVSPLPHLFCHHLEDRRSFLTHLRASPSHCLLAFLVNVPHYSMWAVTTVTTTLIYAVRYGGHRRLFNTSSAASSNWCAVNVFKDLGQKQTKQKWKHLNNF